MDPTPRRNSGASFVPGNSAEYAETASSLAFYGALALAGLGLSSVYAASQIIGHASRHDAWIALAYLPPVDIPWRKVWIASFISAVLYERGQFALSVYLSQMDARSPYADAGVLLAVMVWLYYSAQVVLVGADFTKVLKERGERGRVHSTG